ncbi:MAG TPA: hypothetical protein PK385_03100 [Spirochaetota bacterium]|nr:hypothetical protein [Spirochaetota bacterium]HOS32042.1 hypothetical protein [Spirochaetota bacterium]HOS55026.1 hypothetical protein [Spirochaetota bacterium]HPK60991.1 hypothetical protein [Spirochaetota bacterium]HQF77557.1 hypothetical protein [Spirochaetota bacterium]
MKYDLSIVINEQIQENILNVAKNFKKKRISTIISRILTIMYPYLKYYHTVTKEFIPVYERIDWNKKIHICIDYKIYLALKKIYEDTNGYSMAYIIRRISEYFTENIEKYDDLDSFISNMIILIKKEKNKFTKNQFDVWKFMEKRKIKKLGRIINDGEKREFSIKRPFLSIKYNEYLRPIEFSYT